MSEPEQRRWVRLGLCMPDHPTREALGVTDAEVISVLTAAARAYSKLDAEDLASNEACGGKLDDVLTTLMGRVWRRRTEGDNEPYLFVVPLFTADVPHAVAGHFATLVEQDVFIVLLPLGTVDIRLISLIAEGAGCENVSFVLAGDLENPAKAYGPRLQAWLKPLPHGE